MVGFGWLQCRRVRPVLWDYASERLSEGPMETVEQHLHGCAVCRRELESLRSAQNFLSVCRAEEEPAPPSDWNVLRQRLLTQSPAQQPEPVTPRSHSRQMPAILRGTGLESVRAPWQMQLLTSMGGAFAALGIVAVGYGLLMHRPAAPSAQLALVNNAVKPRSFTPAGKSAKTELVTDDANGAAQTSNASDVAMIGHFVSILNDTRAEVASTPSAPAQVMQPAPAGVLESVGYKQKIAPQPHLASRTHANVKLASSRMVSKRANKSPAGSEESGLHFHRYTSKPEDRLPSSDQTASRYALEQVRPVGNDSEDANNYIVGTVQPIAHEDDHDY